MSNKKSKKQGSGSNGLAYPLTVSFTVAAGTLLLQLLQTRIFGVVFWNHLVYFIISVALLGFGISGTWLSFGRNTWLARALTLRVSAVAFTFSALVSSFVVPRLGMNVVDAFDGVPQTLVMFGNYAAAILPYFFGGWMLGCVFRDHVKHIHKLYFADLIGAGLGCLTFLALIQSLGAIVLVAITCAIVALPVLIYDHKEKFGIPLMAVVVLALGATVAFEDRISRSILPDNTKAFFDSFKNDSGELFHEFSEWNSISRIDVRSLDLGEGRPPTKRIFIDGDAWTRIMVGRTMPPPPFDFSEDGLFGNQIGYLFTEGEDLDRVLVIGTGGGIDVYRALRARARHVDAIEINPTTFRLMTEDYLLESGGLMGLENVHPYNEEGRGFVRNSPHKYDAIIMHGIDTFAAINSGAYVLSENYLYTVEGMMDYISHLSDDGLLVITRWLHEAETPRLFVVCLEALHRLGVEHPEKHIMMTGIPEVGATVFLKRSEYTPDQIDQAQAYLDSQNYPEGILYPRPESESGIAAVLHQYADARTQGTHEEFLATLDFAIHPVYDDSPFFFHFDTLADWAEVFEEQTMTTLIRGNWASFTLFALLAFTTAVVLVFMFLPLAARTRPQIPRFGSWLVYFSCLGVAFIFVEIALMQRFALLLGHPSRSLAIVLAGLLISSGIGSQLGGSRKVSMRVALPILSVLILACAFIYPIIIDAALGQPITVRSIIALALVAPLGILMGMPFPSGLRAVSTAGDDATPWMWGINGGTTVVGSILAIIIAIYSGFTFVLCIAAAAYALAAFLFKPESSESA